MYIHSELGDLGDLGEKSLFITHKKIYKTNKNKALLII